MVPEKSHPNGAQPNAMNLKMFFLTYPLFLSGGFKCQAEITCMSSDVTENDKAVQIGSCLR